jgi:16S rRNA processing protein RimM
MSHVSNPPHTVDLLVGTIGRAHGIKGEVSVHVRTDEPQRRFAVGAVLRSTRGPLTVATTRWHQSRLLVRFEEIPDRTAAELLRGSELRIDAPVGERPSDPEEFYDHQLVGLRVESAEGEHLGEVSDVLHLPAQDLLVVARDGDERLVPFVAELVPDIDVDAGRVVVSDVPGLLDDQPGE